MRELHIIDHQPIEDVRLIDVLSRRQENWIRLVANGRLVQFEGLRNRQEAYLWSSLSRKIFKSSDVDIARIIGHLHPASLKDDWDEKRKGLERLADRVFDLLRDQMPKNTTEALQDQVEQLLKENEKLKAATDRERLRMDKSKPRVTPPAPPRSGRTLDSHFKASPMDLEKSTSTPAAPADPLHAYIVDARRPVLEDNAPTKATKAETDKWIKANIKDKARLSKLEEIAKEIDSIIANLKADKLDLPNLCRKVGGKGKPNARRANSAPPDRLVLPSAIGRSRERLQLDANKELRHDRAWLDALAAEAVMSKLSEGTHAGYEVGWKQWCLWCCMGKKNVYLMGESKEERKADEDELLRFMTYLAHVMKRTEGTIKQRLFAIKMGHLVAGHEDPTLHKVRIWAALNGYKRWQPETKRKYPVLPARRRLSSSESLSKVDRVITWAAVMVGFFFLLRAS